MLCAFVATALAVFASAAPVTVYDRSDLNGYALSLDVAGLTNLTSSWQNDIRSVQVQPGYVFVTYSTELCDLHLTATNALFYMEWMSSTPTLGRIWQAQAESYEVRRTNDYLVVAALYTNVNYKGGVLLLSTGQKTLKSGYSNQISSIMVAPGYTMTASSADGSTTTFTEDSSSLNSIWDKAIVAVSLARTITTTPVVTTLPSVTTAAVTASPRPTSAPQPTSMTVTATSQPAAITAIATLQPVITTTNDNTTVIVGCSAAVVIAILVAVFFVLRSKKNKKKTTSISLVEPFISTNQQRNPNAGLIDLSGLYKVRLDQAMLHLDCVLGYGSFAAVSKGSYNGIPVAVKQLQSSRRSNADIQSFVNEIELMARFNSAHIIKLIGAAWTTPMDLCAVMELMDQGDLKDYLAAHDASVYTWAMKLEALRGIVDGLSYLHSLNIVHRDLKSRNVLLDSVKGVKIVDFGVAKEDVQGTMTMGVGTFRWMAPEVLLESAYSVAADMYSFGMLLSEFDSHHIPYQDLTNPTTGKPLADPAIIGGVLNGSTKPTFSETCPLWVKTLADACLQFRAVDRPTIYDVAATLAKVQVT
ncbi:TKL protein kinase [Saprolegnia diclina VS20]|uniref:TKL protein kinase n=1 Tax=Saprolegnia diclina (strain VS20) TaxID=1156394 RepID=T0R5S0_SAPDV|nr:TKL protein kinase [Saprolegnia diclina VS20]EQC42286.1 TKL protein kinase [Saprolegnia diclina VS20]|eukprot:XP_008603709.1 TKL protein kinase [Saprolegnia diclina VS20]